ncbi:MAG: Ig-like domain-containing protein [Planctomycetota bacterium]|nr:Ig-like domain-containing protein [Planctomycetota bacterium]
MCEDRRVLASSPLLIDINPAGDASPRDFVQLGNYAYFTAENSLSGRELWRTDGTTLGTKLVKDIRAGSGSANPTELTAYKGSLYFAADDGVNGQELWKSDGTESGTVLVKDLHPGQGEQVPYGNGPLRSLPQELTVVGNQLFFSAISAANGRELWKSDGTADGTVLVKDIFGNGSSSVAPSSSPRGLVNLNGTLFFTATDGSTGAELWKSDGTSAGTVMVLDIFSGTTTSNGQTVANSSEPGQLTTVGSTLFFTAVDSGTGRELWKTDGTAAGTVRVKDVRAGADGALTSQDVLIRLGNTLFFSANDGSSGRELWKSDGTSVGTVRVKDIRAGAPDGLTIPGTWAVLGDRLYFAANDGSTGTELWKTDGTDAGTTLVRDLESGAGSSTPQEITTVGTRLFFAATTASGKEAWESDGTSAGTKQVADLAAGATSSNPSSFGQLGGLVLFSASDAVAGQELRVAEVDGRIDARLTIFVDSQAVTIPTGVGTAVGGAALSQIRSVNATGGIRVEPLTNEPLTKFTLGDFFTTWRTNGGQAGNNAAATLSSNQLLGNLANTTKTVKMYVNGQVSKDYENYAIRDGDQIVLVYGSNPVVSLNTNFGPLVMELFLDRKPITVNNFLTYINDGDYVNTFFHRSADSGGKDFVIQAGGFRTNSTTFTSRSQFTSVPQDAQIQNEPGISNVRGTVAMAKLGGQPNSATNQFFVNLHDDNRSLDTNNGGFTVFGAVLDMTTADTVAALPIRDQSVDPYRELPVSESNQLVVVQTIAGQGRIRGARYRDTNGNSRQDSGETGVANSVIYIDSNNNNVLDAGEVSTATDANGNYVFELNPGTYTVRAQASAGFVFTEPLATSKSYTVNVEIGREAIGRSFGESTIVAPTSVDLVAVSDTGTSDSDNFTNRNNSSAQRTLQFLVSGVTSGAEVRIFVDGVQMGTATATGTTVTVTTSGNQAVTDGQREVRAVQIVNGTSSATSPALTLTIDTIAPALFSNTAPALATVNTLYSFDANSPDENLSGMVYSLANAPAGMTISSAGVVSWTPTNTQLVPQQFDIRLSDVAGNAAIQSVSLTVLGTLPAFPDSYSIAEDGVLTVALANGVLFNDGGPNPGTLTASVVQTTSRGTLVLSPNGTFNYTPNANFFGADSFIYKANNGTIDSNHARVTINVTAVNDLPVGVANSYSVSEDTTLAVNVANGVLSNDTDADGDTLAVAVATQPANGSLILNSNGSFSYTPTAQFSGADSFTYTISDGTGNSTPVQVSLTVTAVNDAPVAVADTYSVNEDAVLNIAQPQGVLANDTDAEGSPLTATVVTQPTNGTVLLNANGSFTYTPKANFFGSDSFTYRANDGSLDSAAATVTITIADQPDPPSAVDDTASVVVTGALIDVLKNDVANAGNNQLLTIQSFTQGASGVVTLENNQLRYVPRSGFVGTDTFTYVTQNASGLSDSGSVTVTVTNPDGNRISGFVFLDADKNGTRATTESGVPGVLVTLTGKNTNGVALPSRTALTADDGSYSFRDLLAGTYEVTQRQPAALKDGKESVVVSGALAGEDKITNLVVTGGGSYENNNFGELQLEPSYVSIAWFFASSSKPVSASTAPIFRQMVAAGEQRSGDLPLAAAIRSGSTTPPVVNAIPVAVADSYAVPQGQVLTVNAANGVLKNDTDADGTTLTAIVATQPQQGALTLNADGSFTYTPTTTFNGTDAFTYRASDGKGTSAPQTVTITVGNPALNQVLTIAENSAQGTLVGTLTAGSALNQPITFALKNGSNANAFNLDGATGRVTVSDSVALNFEQQASYSLTVEAVGANGQRQNINATINVTNVNEKPVGVNDSYTVNENAVLTVVVAAGVVSNDTDPDANSLTVELVTNVAHGQLALNPNGSFSYTPTARFVGADSFTYRAKDATLSSDPITVAIQVNDVNAAPVAVADSFTTNEDVVLSVAVADGVLKNDTDADGDSLTAQLVTTVSKGQLIFNANGSFNYTPNANANGTDSFTYRVSDGTLTSNVVTVTLNVTSVNDPPVGVADSYTVNEDVTLTVNAATGVLKNDTDADGTTLTASVVTQPQHGSLTLNSDGSFTYQPTANYNGTDTFTYRAGDGTSFSAATTVTITVNAVNDGPTVVRNDSYRTDVNQVLTVTAANGVLANDQDPDRQALVATLQANVQHGTLDLSPNGSFVYTPTTGYRGAD